VIGVLVGLVAVLTLALVLRLFGAVACVLFVLGVACAAGVWIAPAWSADVITHGRQVLVRLVQ
jgi:hypothetical protein